MNRDVCEHFNPVDLPCEKRSVQKSTLREAAQQALEAMETVELDIEWRAASPTHKMLSKAITALRAALAEQTVPSDCTDSHQPVAWIHTDPDKPRVKFLEWREDEPGYRGRWIKTPLYTARAIERAHGIGEKE